MSAYLVSPEHIAAIVGTATVFARRQHERVRDPMDMARILAAENARSVNFRYPDHEPCRAVEVSQAMIDAFSLAPLVPVEMLKALNCYGYQACEADGYEETDAAKLVEWMTRIAVYCLPGYDEAPWGIDSLPAPASAPQVRTTRSRCPALSLVRS